MTPEPLRFSVIVASWERLPWLRRCLGALAMQDYPAFEIVVVADGPSLAAIDTSHLKIAEVPEAHLARARNIGIARASGEVCAFIDDDAVAEPMWLRRLGEALQTTRARAVAGYVRGRNGISFQSRIASVDAEAETHAEPAAGDAPFRPQLAPERALKLVGTNMAVRRDTLLELGGFDTMFRFYLEDTDLSLRLAGAGHAAVVAPRAEVHHAFAPSSRRSAARAPRDLTDIGRSTAIFLRRHAGAAAPEILERLRRREHARLIRHLVAGTCEPRDVPRLMAGLDSGWVEGSAVELSRQPLPTIPCAEFRAMPVVAPGHDVYAVPYLFRRRTALANAEKRAASGRRTTLFSFSLTPVRHRVVHTPGGVWLHRGGVFGQVERTEPAFRWCSFADKVRAETRRVAESRGIGDNPGM